MKELLLKSLDKFFTPETIGNTIFGGLALAFIIFLFRCAPKGKKRIYHRISQSREQKACCESYQKYLADLNEATKWDETYFTPLDAEIESDHKGRQKKYYKDLLTCLKKNRKGNRIFLLLGLPGTGKSVSLRKLCGELLQEAAGSGQIPLYINLKEWDNPFTLSEPPTETDLNEFILRQIQGTNKLDVSSYLTAERFEQLRKRKKLYFIFDSFDELPCLLGKRQDESTESHEALI